MKLRSGPPRGVSAPYSENADSGLDAGPRSGGDMPVQTLTTADYEAGIVLAEVRYAEHHDFSPADGAEICGDWRAFGAAALRKHKFKVIIAGMCKISPCDASNG